MLLILIKWCNLKYYKWSITQFSSGIDTDSANIETDIEEETIEFFIKEEIEVIEDSEWSGKNSWLIYWQRE